MSSEYTKTLSTPLADTATNCNAAHVNEIQNEIRVAVRTKRAATTTLNPMHITTFRRLRAIEFFSISSRGYCYILRFVLKGLLKVKVCLGGKGNL